MSSKRLHDFPISMTDRQQTALCVLVCLHVVNQRAKHTFPFDEIFRRISRRVKFAHSAGLRVSSLP